MNKGILWTIKIGAIFIVLVFITIAKEIGVPILVANLIGWPILFAIWAYKPITDDNNGHRLNKD